MKNTIKKVLREQLENDLVDGKSLKGEMEKAIEHNRALVEHFWSDGNTPLNQYSNAYYKILNIDDYDADQIIEYNLLFVDDEREHAIEIEGYNTNNPRSNKLAWRVTKQGGYDNSFMGGGTPRFQSVNPEGLEDDGFILFDKKMTFKMSKYQNKVSNTIQQMADSGKDTMGMSIKLSLTLLDKLEERNNKVKSLKGSLRVKNVSDEVNMSKEIINIKNRLQKMLGNEGDN